MADLTRCFLLDDYVLFFRDNIRYDLLRTGNVGRTTEKILERGFLDAVRIRATPFITSSISDLKNKWISHHLHIIRFTPEQLIRLLPLLLQVHWLRFR